MRTDSYIDVLQEMNFTDDVLVPGRVRIVRHKAAARTFFNRGWFEFEEFQRFQRSREFGESQFVVAFLGQMGKGGLSSFLGVYKVGGCSSAGTKGYVEPTGPPDLLAELSTTKRYRYELTRVTELDPYVGRWEIDWMLPHNAWSLKLREGLLIKTTSFDGPYLADTALIPLLEEQAESFIEGALQLVKHVRRERSTALVRAVKNFHKSHGTYRCDVCQLTPGQRYVDEIDCLECHRVMPLHSLSGTSTPSVNDMVLLCSNCHTAVHKHKSPLARHELTKILIA